MSLRVDQPLLDSAHRSPIKATVDLRSAQEALLSTVGQCTDEQEAIATFLRLANGLTNAVVAGHFANGQEQGTVLDSELNGIGQPDQQWYWEEFLECSMTAQRECAPRVVRLTDPEYVALAVPVASQQRPPDSLAILLLLPTGSVEPFIVTLQMIASYIMQWRIHNEKRGLNTLVANLAALVELVEKVEASDSTRQAHLVVVNELQRFLRVERVVLALRKKNDAQMKLRAVSGVASFDKNSDRSHNLEAALTESSLHESLAAWPPLSPEARHLTIAHREVVESGDAEAIVSSALTTTDGETIGALALLGKQSDMQSEKATGLIAAAAPRIASALTIVRRAEGGPLKRLARTVLRGAFLWKFIVACLALSGVIGGMFVPVNHRMSTPCEVEPVVRHFAVVPYEGLLMEGLVRPGDLVRQDQVLARMDDREIRWELAGLTAEHTQALKKRDISMVEQKIDEAQLHSLEAQRLDLRIKLLRHRLNNLEIKSPRDGVVLSGDQDGANGIPVSVGDPLYEVALIDPLRLELHVEGADVAYVEPNMEVYVRLEGYKDQITGVIDRVHPQSVTREGKNVFVAEVPLENADNVLRPGMRGDAKVIGHKRPLGWVLFHKAWSKICAIAGW